ncbi:hemolysin family protein [Tomitella biformata]|uniref:hemolysin family protein n=1 Tax=Tomitella biformata TaxID=630403 RepID=UPI000463C2A9|nr:hemolysin family protein [Tomitella biformata]
MGAEHIALIVGVAVLVPLGGLFAAIDSAINTVSPARIDELVKESRPGAPRLATIVVDRPRYVNLLVLLRITCELVATVLLAGLLIGALPKVGALALAASIMVVLSYVVIGVGPRTLGRQHAYPIGLAAAVPLQVIGTILDPVSRVLILLGNAITPGPGFRQGPFASEIELRELVDMAQERGVVADDERRMIQSVFDLGDTSAREVMVPRTEMVWIEADKTAGQMTSLAVRSGHSRIPVIGDSADDVIGIVYLKDVVTKTYYSVDGGRSVTVGQLMRPAVFVPDSKRLDALLDEMQRDRNHMAMLVDEYGGIAGLVTIEDIIEEIVGEIADEYDQSETPPVEELLDGTYRLSARLPIDDLGELFDVEMNDPEVETVGGLLAHELGRVPLPGSQVSTHGIALTAEGGRDPRGRIRVTTILASRLEESAPEDSQQDPTAQLDASQHDTPKYDAKGRDHGHQG